MKLFATSKIANNESCIFTDSNDKTLYHTKTEVLDNTAVTYLYNSVDNEIAKISYVYNKLKILEFTVEMQNKESFKVSVEENDKLMCKELGLRLSRNLFDSKIKLHKDENLVMEAKCKTLIRKWLVGEYEIDVIDQNNIDLYVLMLIISFISLADSHSSTTSPHF